MVMHNSVYVTCVLHACNSERVASLYRMHLWHECAIVNIVSNLQNRQSAKHVNMLLLKV